MSKLTPFSAGTWSYHFEPALLWCCIACSQCLEVLACRMVSHLLSLRSAPMPEVWFFSPGFFAFLKCSAGIWSPLLSLNEGRLAGSWQWGWRGLKKWNVNSRLLSGLAQSAIRCEAWIEICGVWRLAQTELEFNHLKACPARHSHCVGSWNRNILCTFNQSHRSVWFYRSLHLFLAPAYDK